MEMTRAIGTQGALAFSLCGDVLKDSASFLSLQSSPPGCIKRAGLISWIAFHCVVPGESWPVRDPILESTGEEGLFASVMLGKIEGRRRGRQRMRQLDGITDSMDKIGRASCRERV